MSLQLTIRNLKPAIEYIKKQSERRKTWRPELAKFYKRNMRLQLILMVDRMRNDANFPQKTGTMKNRLSYKFDAWHSPKLFINEDIAPINTNDWWRYWRAGRKARYWEYAFFVAVREGFSFWDGNRIANEMVDVSIDIVYAQWAVHWHK